MRAGPAAWKTRSDWRLVAQAINQGWDPSRQVRTQIVADAHALLDDPATPPRLVLAVVRVCVLMETHNQAIDFGASLRSLKRNDRPLRCSRCRHTRGRH